MTGSGGRPTLSCGDLAYEWIDGWGPDAGEGRESAWPHHGIVAGPTEILQFHHARPWVVALSPDGEVRRTFAAGVPEAHGMCLDGDSLWLADAGNQILRETGYALRWQRTVGEVVRISLDGEVLQRLPPPRHDVYSTTPYRPTAVARDPRSRDVFVADGYGASVVHRYDDEGRHLATFDGSGGPAASPRRTSSSSTGAADTRSCTCATAGTPGSRCTAWTASSVGRSTRARSPPPPGSRRMVSAWSSSSSSLHA